MDDAQFRKLLEAFGFSWQGYRKVRKGVKKRIARHMQAMDCRDMQGYLQTLQKQPDCWRECERLLTVSISRFFRDRQLWQVLLTRILPDLIRRHPERLQVWSAGCAGGEEVYSLLMVWHEQQAMLDKLPHLRLIGTDLNRANLERCRTAVYRQGSLKEVPHELRGRYFEHCGHKGAQYAVRGFLKESIIWRQHNLLQDTPPEACFDLILLRNNILTYCAEPLKTVVFKKIAASLAVDGYLVIGSHEKLPQGSTGFRMVLPLAYLFCKIGR